MTTPENNNSFTQSMFALWDADNIQGRLQQLYDNTPIDASPRDRYNAIAEFRALEAELIRRNSHYISRLGGFKEKIGMLWTSDGSQPTPETSEDQIKGLCSFDIAGASDIALQEHYTQVSRAVSTCNKKTDLTRSLNRHMSEVFDEQNKRDKESAVKQAHLQAVHTIGEIGAYLNTEEHISAEEAQEIMDSIMNIAAAIQDGQTKNIAAQFYVYLAKKTPDVSEALSIDYNILINKLGIARPTSEIVIEWTPQKRAQVFISKLQNGERTMQDMQTDELHEIRGKLWDLAIWLSDIDDRNKARTLYANIEQEISRRDPQWDGQNYATLLGRMAMEGVKMEEHNQESNLPTTDTQAASDETAEDTEYSLEGPASQLSSHISGHALSFFKLPTLMEQIAKACVDRDVWEAVSKKLYDLARVDYRIKSRNDGMPDIRDNVYAILYYIDGIHATMLGGEYEVLAIEVVERLTSKTASTSASGRILVKFDRDLQIIREVIPEISGPSAPRPPESMPINTAVVCLLQAGFLGKNFIATAREINGKAFTADYRIPADTTLPLALRSSQGSREDRWVSVKETDGTFFEVWFAKGAFVGASEPEDILPVGRRDYVVSEIYEACQAISLYLETDALPEEGTYRQYGS